MVSLGGHHFNDPWKGPERLQAQGMLVAKASLNSVRWNNQTTLSRIKILMFVNCNFQSAVSHKTLGTNLLASDIRQYGWSWEN